MVEKFPFQRFFLDLMKAKNTDEAKEAGKAKGVVTQTLKEIIAMLENLVIPFFSKQK